MLQIIGGVFRNNVDFFHNFTMLCCKVIKIISMCFLYLLAISSLSLFSSDVLGQSYRLSKRVTYMNPGHVKGVHDFNEVTIFSLMDITFREIHFLSNYPPRKAIDCWYRCIHRLYTPLYYP